MQCGCHLGVANVTCQVNIEEVLPLLTATGRARFKTRHADTVFFQGLYQLIQGARAVDHGQYQAGTVMATGFRHGQCLWQAHYRKACAIVGLVLDGRCHHMQTKLTASAQAGNGCCFRIVGGNARTFAVAASSITLGVW